MKIEIGKISQHTYGKNKVYLKVNDENISEKPTIDEIITQVTELVKAWFK